MVTKTENKMPLVTYEARTLLICFNEQSEESQREGSEEVVTTYTYDYARVDKTATRADIIDSIIRSRYSQRDMEAVNNNFLDSEHTEEDVANWNAMQTWRKTAKEVATSVINQLKAEEAEV